MSSVLNFPKANPIRIVILEWQSRLQNDIDYNLWHTLSYPNSEVYQQKFQQSDTLIFQFHTSFSNNFVELVRCDNQEVVISDYIEEQMLFEDSVEMDFEDDVNMLFEGSDDSPTTRVNQEATYETREFSLSLANIEEGCYYIQVYGNHTDTLTYYARSEIFDVRAQHLNTVLFSYYNYEPAFGIDYRSNVTLYFRILADFIKIVDETDLNDVIVSADTYLTKVTDRTIQQRELEFLEEVPAWVAQKVNLILGHDVVTINELNVVGRNKITFDYNVEGKAWVKPKVTIPIRESNLFNRHDSGSRVLFS